MGRSQVGFLYQCDIIICYLVLHIQVIFSHLYIYIYIFILRSNNLWICPLNLVSVMSFGASTVLDYSISFFVGFVDGETWCVIVRNDIYGDSSSVIINKSQEISLINFYFNKTVFTHFIKKAHVQNPLFLTLL